MSLLWRRARVGEAGIVTAEGVEVAIGTDDVRAAAVNAVVVPTPGVHEGLYQNSEGVGFVHFELAEQRAERLGFAATAHQIFEAVTNLVLEEALDFGEVNELADGMNLAVGL